MSSTRPMTGYAAPYRSGDGAVFTMADLVQMISARRRLILGVTLGVVLAALITILLLPTTYSSSAVVMMDQRHNTITDLSSVLSELPGDPATLQNQIQILTSRELATQVITKLELYNDPEFNPVLTQTGNGIGTDILAFFNLKLMSGNTGDAGLSDAQTARIHDQIIANFLKHITAEANGLSTAITLTATSRDAEKASRIANAMVQAYIDDQVAVKISATGQTNDWLNQRIKDLGQQLQAQDQAVALYKAQHGLNDTTPGGSLIDQQLVGINNAIVQARSDLAEKQATADRINALIQSGHPADVAQVVSSPAIIQLKDKQTGMARDEADMMTKYGPLNPKLIALEAQKRDLDQQMSQEVTRIAGASNSDLVVAKAHLASLEQSLGGAAGVATGQNMARVQLAALQSNADSTRVQYETFVARLRQTQDQDAVQVPESRIISTAPIPITPSAPKRGLILAASVPAGLLLGLIVALILEKFGTLWPVTVNGNARATLVPAPRSQIQGLVHAKPPRPVYVPPAPRPAAPPATRPSVRPAVATPLAASWDGPPILAEIADPAAMKAGDYVLDYPRSNYASHMTELVRQLESRTGAAIVAVTSAEPGDNKSAIGVSLARSAALAGKKTLLIDCDPAQSATGAMHAQSGNGLYDVLTGAIPLGQTFVKDSRSDAFVLAMNKRPPNLSAMFASGQMARLISILRDGCDMVVIDCGRAGANPDAALLARLADATVLVSRAGALYAPSLANAVRALTGAKAAPVGLVVTK